MRTRGLAGGNGLARQARGGRGGREAARGEWEITLDRRLNLTRDLASGNSDNWQIRSGWDAGEAAGSKWESASRGRESRREARRKLRRVAKKAAEEASLALVGRSRSSKGGVGNAKSGHSSRELHITSVVWRTV